MRKVVIISSLISFFLLSVGLTIRLLTNPANLVWPTLPWFLSTSLMITGFIIMLVAMICYTLYFYWQERAKEQTFPQIEGTLDLLFWPIAPASILICTFLSKDLASQDRKKP